MNYEEFYGAVCEMAEKFEASRAANRELDAYLLALLRLLEARGGEPFSAELMLEILSAAFESERAEPSETWLEIERAPEFAHFCKDGPAGGGDTFRSAEEPKTAPSEAKFMNGKSKTQEQNSIATSGSLSAKTVRNEPLGPKTNEPLKFEATDKHGGLAYSAEVIKFQLADSLRTITSFSASYRQAGMAGIISIRFRCWSAERAA